MTVAQEPNIAYTDRPFQEGEELVYCVYYNWKFVWIPAGEVKFTIQEKNNEVIFHVTGRSYPSYDSFFKVRDDYVSSLDKETFLPSMFRRDIHEGNYHRFDSISFNQKSFQVKEYFGKTRKQAKLHKFDLDKTVQDMISAIYSLRSVNLDKIKKKDNIPISVFFDKELFDINIRFYGEKIKKIKGYGKVETFHFQPELIDGYVFKEGDLMDIWVYDDNNKIPILIESPITLGSVKAILTSAKGTKYPFLLRFPE